VQILNQKKLEVWCKKAILLKRQPKKTKKGAGGQKPTSLSKASNRPTEGMDRVNIATQVQMALMLITGQKPEERLFRVSRPGLNIREGKSAAFRVSLRKKSVYYFLDRLITDIFPNLKDSSFKGFNSDVILKSDSV